MRGEGHSAEQCGFDPGPLVDLLPTSAGPVRGFAAPGARAVEWWRSLRSMVEDLGHWPVIFGDDDSVAALKESLERSRDEPVERTVEAAGGIDVQAWFRSRRQEMVEDMGPEEQEEFAATFHGPWPDLRPATRFVLPLEPVSRQPLSRVWIGLAPVRRGSDVPAVLHYGGWNQCPAPAEHIAVLDHWQSTYGAELVGMSFDVVELAVSRPPPDRESALWAAEEQFAYCEDIVLQGTETIEALAATLVSGTAWYFWWD